MFRHITRDFIDQNPTIFDLFEKVQLLGSFTCGKWRFAPPYLRL